MGNLVGRSLAHFRIVAELGEGGMGVVYRATDEKLRRQVALKVLPDSIAKDGERRERFFREARSAAAVTHANIATVHDVGEADGHVFIAMELVEGETLRVRLERGISVPDALRFARGIARGLRRAHEKGIVHRDLKPENLMISPDDEVKILDFGLAKLRDEEVNLSALGEAKTEANLTKDGRILGTPAYMSPEQARGEPVDARTDVFSFGVVLFEMLTGTRPFNGGTPMAMILAACHDAPKRAAEVNPEVSAEIEAMVARCLEKKAGDRYANGREVLDALGAAEPGGVVSSRHSGPGAVSQRTGDSASGPVAKAAPVAPRRRGAVLAASVLAMGVVAAGAAVAMRHAREPSVAHPSASAASVPDAGRRGVALTDHPAPVTSNRDAALHYASALARLRVGALQSRSELERALSLDPGLAAAQLRFALLSPWYALSVANTRERFAKASELEAALDARERSLLHVAEALTTDPVDYSEVIARARTVVERYPEDAEASLLLAIYRRIGRQTLGIEELYAHILDLDPGCSQVLRLRAEDAMLEGGPEEVSRLLDSCVAEAPKASYCREMRVESLGARGDCDAMLAEARALVAREPDISKPYLLLAQALAATGAPVEGVSSALEQADARESGDPLSLKTRSSTKVALLTGDLATVEALTVQARDMSNSERDHSTLTGLRIALAEESGDRAKPIQIAEGFERQGPAWVRDAPLEVRLKRLYLLHEAGKLDDDAFAAQRDGLSQEAKSVMIDCAKSAELPLATYFRYAETVAEANDALARHGASIPRNSGLAGGGWLPCGAFSAPLSVGQALLLAGRVDEAATALEESARACSVIGSHLAGLDLQLTLDFIHSHVLLGQALEAKRDDAGACKAYGAVLDRWRNAKPRSVSLEKARERSRALGCGS